MDFFYYCGVNISRENKNSTVMAFSVIMAIIDPFTLNKTLSIDFALVQETASLVMAAIWHSFSLWVEIPDFLERRRVLDYQRVHRFLYYWPYPFQ